MRYATAPPISDTHRLLISWAAHMIVFQFSVVMIWNTTTSAPCPRWEGQKLSKLLRGASALTYRKPPPKNCIPKSAHMYMNMAQTIASDHSDPRAIASVLRILRMSFQLLASLNSLKSRAPRNAENVPLLLSVETSPAKNKTNKKPCHTLHGTPPTHVVYQSAYHKHAHPPYQEQGIICRG